jgi:RNA polymerase sigma-70 factor (ECF subfamily)
MVATAERREGVASGSPREFDAFYASHAAVVRRMLTHQGVRSDDLDDVLQESFVTIHRLLPTFEGRSSIETWLYSVTWRIASSYHRQRRTRRESPRVVDEPSNAPPPVIAFDRIHASFANVQEEDRDLLALREIGGLSISSLAELTGAARATIRTRLERGSNAVVRALSRSPAHDQQDAWFERMAARFQARPEAPAPVLHALPCGQICFSTLDDMIIAVWRGPTTAEALHLLTEVMIAHMQRWPEGIRYLSVVEATSTPPTREGRELMTWIAKELGPSLSATVGVIEGSALMTLAASVLNSSLFLARSPLKARLFGDLPAGVHAITRSGSPDATQTLAHVQAMRACMKPFQHPAR